MMSEIRDLIKRLIDSETEIQTFPATVKAVDKTAQTCKVKPVDNSPELNDVRLRASIKDTEDGHIIYPVQDSTVLVTLINNEPSVAFVSYVSEVDEVLMNLESTFKVTSNNANSELFGEEVHLNGSNQGALIVIADLVSQLNRLERKHNTLVTNFNALVTAYNAHTHPGVTPGGGTTSPPPTPGSPSTATVAPPTKESDLANDKVKHGDG